MVLGWQPDLALPTHCQPDLWHMLSALPVTLPPSSCPSSCHQAAWHLPALDTDSKGLQIMLKATSDFKGLKQPFLILRLVGVPRYYSTPPAASLKPY